MDKKFKIIIGVLSAAVAVLAIVLIYVWSDRNSYINELTIDKENLTAEMLQLQQDYAQLSSTNDTLNNEILLEREKVAQLIERVQKTEATNKAMLRKYEKELGTLRSIMRNYIKQIDSLNTLNNTLRAEAAEAKQQARESNSRYENLKSTTEELGKQVELGSIVKGRGLVMTGVTESGKETDRSSRTSKLKACLNLVENSIAKKGPRTVYIRVKGPDGILMTADQQHLFTFEGEQMIYSASREVDYQGAEVEVCIYFDPGQKLTKGVYTVEAYTEEARLAATDMLLR
ncbi:MAG: hypothetical protein IAC68_06990 [Bacteroidetes bacterium]|uniref:Chromosome segregation protein SMC n=1 Tax=Candidatus Egerieousia excrementavium TaxID=2840778 RepID=A0A9D9DM84_9BACT|nr:hypothetical protein [Candidatus Egerieousia excrementavium]